MHVQNTKYVRLLDSLNSTDTCEIFSNISRQVIFYGETIDFRVLKNTEYSNVTIPVEILLRKKCFFRCSFTSRRI